MNEFHISDLLTSWWLVVPCSADLHVPPTEYINQVVAGQRPAGHTIFIQIDAHTLKDAHPVIIKLLACEIG